MSQNFTRFVSVCSNTAYEGQEDGLSGSFDRPQLLANLLLWNGLCRYGSLCLMDCQVAIDRALEPSLARSRALVLFLWLCSTEDKPKVELSVKLLSVLLAGGSRKQVERIQTGLYEMSWYAL